MMELQAKKVLLTGATGGIGRAMAAVLDGQGAQLLLVGRDQEKLAALQAAMPGKHSVIIADINTEAGRRHILDCCRQREPDIFINAAGVLGFQLYPSQDLGEIERMVMTNLLAPMLLTRLLIPLLAERPEAAIVHVGSIFGSIGHPGFTAYCASKFGLRGFTEALQRELHDSAIQVSYLAPRATSTELNSESVNALNEALGNTTDSPQRVAEELLLLFGKRSRQRYLGWPENFFVRLNGLFPGLVHNALVKKLPLIRHHAGQ